MTLVSGQHMKANFPSLWLRLAVALVGVVGLSHPAVQAAPMPEFTGYTRIGIPSDDWPKDDPRRAEVLKKAKPIGITIYYMVLDRESGRGTPGDRWGTGIPNFDNYFVAGMNNDRSTIDPDARYLYLYQLVNDSGRPAAIRTVSIRLIVDPRLITSWGHFVERKKTDKGEKSFRGVGFALPAEDKIGKETKIRTVSTAFQPVSNKQYLSPAPAVKTSRVFSFAPISLGELVPVAEGEDVGREPDAVLIVPNAELGRGDKGEYLRPSLINDTERLPGMDNPKYRDLIRRQWQTRWPVVRAYWNTELVKPMQRSTIFGFTSMAPPTLAETSVGGRSLNLGIDKPEDGKVRPAGDDERGPEDRNLAAAFEGPTGTLPTPIIEELPQPVTPAATDGGIGPLGGGGGGLGAFPGGLGGLPAVGGTGLSGGGGALGGAFFPARGGAGGGGGGFGVGGGGSSDSGSGGNTGQDQNQDQRFPITNTVNVNVNQSQTQQQQQQQQQQQGQFQGQANINVNVIPIPSAWLLGLLGLPAFYFFGRRTKPAAQQGSEQTVDSTQEA